MKIDYILLDDCEHATGVVVVIDVLRAFTTAAHAFHAGVKRIWPVSKVSEARALQQTMSHALLAGEEHGLPIPGFDFGNSPTQFVGMDLQGREMIQRTTAGTQGLVRSVNAEFLFAASFVCAQATVNAILQLQPANVTFVITGQFPGNPGDEDWACAEYLATLLQGDAPDPTPWLQRVRKSFIAQRFLQSPPNFPATDVSLAMQLDRFDFSMPVQRIDERLCIVPHHSHEL